MRAGLRVGATVSAVAALILICWLAAADVALADRYQPLPPPIDSEFDPPPTPPPASPPAAPRQGEDLDELRQRLNALEQRLQRQRLADEAAAEREMAAEGEMAPAPWMPADFAPCPTACREIDLQTRPSHRFRGRMFLDHLMVEDSANRAYDNFTGFDSIRLGVAGNIYENLKYVVEFEFEGEETDYKDIFAQFDELPWVSTARLGFFRQPVSLEEQTSSRFNTFMERSLATTQFSPSRKFGLRIGGDVRDNENLSAWGAIYRDLSNDDPANSGGFYSDHNDTGFAARVVWLPYYDEPSDGRYFLHTGGSFYHARHYATSGANLDAVNPTGTFRGSLELDSYDSVIGTQLADGADYHTFATELAWVNGPFSIQNEFYWLNASDGANPWGTYVEVSYFLTGESRGYDRVEKAFGRVHPFEPFFAVRTANGVCRGWGAWQLTARWSYLDASDADLTVLNNNPAAFARGTQSNITLGVNWYLNPYSRVMLNYVHANASPNAGNAGGFVDTEVDNVGLRFQVDW